MAGGGRRGADGPAGPAGPGRGDGRSASATLDAATAADRAHLAAMQLVLREMQARLNRVVETQQAVLDADLAPLQTALDEVRQAVERKAADFHPTLPPRPEPTLDVDEQQWLSDR